MADCLSELSPAEFGSLLNGLALMSQLYWGPTPELCRELSSPSLVEELMELSTVLGPQSSRPARELLDWLQRSRDASELFDCMESAYVSLFVNHRGGAPAPIYQSCYDRAGGALMGRPALVMQQRLDQAGIDLAAKTSEPADHLAVELEYLYLLLEQAYMRDDPSLLADARDFAALELLSWVEPMRTKLPCDESCHLFAAATDLLLAMLRLTAGCA